jgi:hypothetical protein
MYVLFVCIGTASAIISLVYRSVYYIMYRCTTLTLHDLVLIVIVYIARYSVDMCGYTAIVFISWLVMSVAIYIIGLLLYVVNLLLLSQH